MQLACNSCIIPLLILSKTAREVAGCGKQDTIVQVLMASGQRKRAVES